MNFYGITGHGGYWGDGVYCVNGMASKQSVTDAITDTYDKVADTTIDLVHGICAAGGCTCYAYGTTVVRRSAEGTNETVPIEDVEEGDYILAKGTEGLFFTAAIVVDLHPASNSEALTLKTNSGQHVTLTREHMTLVHDSHRQELVPARLVRPGNWVEVMNGDGLTMLDEVIEVSPADPSTVKGLANIHTGAETIVANGVVGSTHSEYTTNTVARKFARYGLVLLNQLAGPEVTRKGYRMAEWLLA